MLGPLLFLSARPADKKCTSIDQEGTRDKTNGVFVNGRKRTQPREKKRTKKKQTHNITHRIAYAEHILYTSQQYKRGHPSSSFPPPLPPRTRNKWASCVFVFCLKPTIPRGEARSGGGGLVVVLRSGSGPTERKNIYKHVFRARCGPAPAPFYTRVIL